MEEKVIMDLERYIDIMDDNTDLKLREEELEDLLDILFKNTRLSITGDGLRINDEFKLINYLEARYKDRYDLRLNKLKKEVE